MNPPPLAESAVDVGRLAATVQRNCDLADAVHAREKSLCTYLLSLREYYRWQTDLPLGATPDREGLGRWIAAREQAWDQLRSEAARGFDLLPLAFRRVDPFDETTINAHLAGHRLVYGAGIGLFGAQLFFLAEIESSTTRDGVPVLVAGRELARGLAAVPAASRGGAIVVRGDALRRWLWTRIEGRPRGRRTDALSAALQAYGVDDDAAMAVDRLVDAVLETVVLHELGELRAGEELGPEWEEMLAECAERRAELLLRAVRDLIADASVTLPALLQLDDDGPLLFWLSNFEGLRRELAPDFAHAFDPQRGGPLRTALQAALPFHQQHWLLQAAKLRSAWRAGGSETLTRALSSLSKDP
jgi:hypothetical protein